MHTPYLISSFFLIQYLNLIYNKITILCPYFFFEQVLIVIFILLSLHQSPLSSLTLFSLYSFSVSLANPFTHFVYLYLTLTVVYFRYEKNICQIELVNWTPLNVLSNSIRYMLRCGCKIISYINIAVYVETMFLYRHFLNISLKY